jgi:hypothetical protein
MKFFTLVKNNIWLSTLAVFCLFFATYGSIYLFADGISAKDDHFFHIKLAYLLRTENLNIISNFDYYPINKYSRFPLSLFNIFLIPFTFFKDLFVGLRVADVFGAALSMSVIYFALRKFKFKYVFLILLILISSAFFSTRLFYGRSYVLTFGLILLELYFAQKKEYLKFFWIALFHVLWHQSSFFLPAMVAGSVEIGRYLAEKRINFKIIIASLSSIILGLAFFPDFPKNIYSWFFEIVNLSNKVSVGLKLEGNELYTKDILQMFSSNQIFAFLSVVSVILTIYFYVKMKREEDFLNDAQKKKLTEVFSFFLMLIVFILGAITISGRFFDYYFVLVVVLFASILALIIDKKEFIVNEKIQKYIITACFIFFFYLSLNNFLDLRINVSRSDYQTMKAPAEWIRNNSKEKEMVYLYNWSDFPLAIFYNDKNIYSWGMEPRDLSFKSNALYWKAYNIMLYNLYCEKQIDCKEDALIFNEKIKKLEEDNEKEDADKLAKENSQKIINSIKKDFNSRLILSSSTKFSGIVRLNQDMIEDQFETNSEVNNPYKITAFKIK